MPFDSAPQHENTNEKPVPTPVAPVKKENIFLKQETDEMRELSKLERELSALTIQIGTIKEQMRVGKYPGKLTDLAELTAKKDLLTTQINNHPKFKPTTIKNNFTGRDARADRKNN